jgi:hypothetical protein
MSANKTKELKQYAVLDHHNELQIKNINHLIDCSLEDVTDFFLNSVGPIIFIILCKRLARRQRNIS